VARKRHGVRLSIDGVQGLCFCAKDTSSNRVVVVLMVVVVVVVLFVVEVW